jgi:2-(1,2-epoxy-1,2-dihydrophenyl)acetyl-CoA isomerase
MSGNTIRASIEDGVGVIVLNRPEKLNALSEELHAELRAALDRFEQDAAARVVLVTGEGRAFSSGQDLTVDLPRDADGRTDLGATLTQNYNPLCLRLLDYPKLTIAALNGLAVGAGLNVALACDIALAARSAYLQQVFVKIALIPDAGGTWLLPRIVGMKRALALALTGDRVSAEEAERMGLVYRVFDDASFAGDARAFARALANGPTGAYRLIKQALSKSRDHDFAEQLALEAQLQGEAGRAADFGESMRAFAEKRPPNFLGG